MFSTSWTSPSRLRCWPTSLADEGGDVDRAEIGRIALQKIEPASFDLVRSDLRMLELTGMVLLTTRARSVSERLGSAS